MQKAVAAIMAKITINSSNALDEHLVRKKGIAVGYLLYFKAKDFKKELGVEGKEAIAMVRKLKR